MMIGSFTHAHALSVKLPGGLVMNVTSLRIEHLDSLFGVEAFRASGEDRQLLSSRLGIGGLDNTSLGSYSQ